MKKIIFIFLVLTLVLFGCTSNVETKVSKSPTPIIVQDEISKDIQTTVVSEDNEVAIGEMI